MTWEYWRDMRKLKPSEYKFFGWQRGGGLAGQRDTRTQGVAFPEVVAPQG